MDIVVEKSDFLLCRKRDCPPQEESKERFVMSSLCDVMSIILWLWMAMGIEKSECPMSNPMIPWLFLCQSTHWIFKELQSETKVVGKIVLLNIISSHFIQQCLLWKFN